jgi:hypothetical protein
MCGSIGNDQSRPEFTAVRILNRTMTHLGYGPQARGYSAAYVASITTPYTYQTAGRSWFGPLGPLNRRRAISGTEHEISGPSQAESGPEVIELDRLVHVENRERSEDRQGDDLLQDLQLSETQRLVADPISGDLK